MLLLLLLLLSFPLYVADFLVYLLVCLQMCYFYYNPFSNAAEETDEVQPNMYRFQFGLDYVKV